MARFTGSGAFIMQGQDARAYDIEFANTAGLELDTANEHRVENCKFQGTYGVSFVSSSNGAWVINCEFVVTDTCIRQTVSSSVQPLIVSDCQLTGDSGIVASSGSFEDLFVSNCTFDMGTPNGVGIDPGVAERLIVMGNYIYNTTSYAILAQNSAGSIDRILIANNHIVGTTNGILIDAPSGGNKILIMGNVIDTVTGTPGAAIHVMNANEGFRIIGNEVYSVTEASGIELEDTVGGIVVGNNISTVGYHGIHLHNANESVIASNRIEFASSDTADTYDGIFLEDNSDENLINHNMVFAASDAQYAINVSAATCDNNVYVGNYALGTFGTGTYNDAGTGTQITYPGAASPTGDNFS